MWGGGGGGAKGWQSIWSQGKAKLLEIHLHAPVAHLNCLLQAMKCVLTLRNK